jgi:hypothetical protein
MIDETIDMIRRWAIEATRPAAMLSFGKDSMVLADLIRRAIRYDDLDLPRTHGFPVPVIYHRDPWFAQKHQFAEEVIRSWAMEVHDWAPAAAGIKVKDDALELVARYHFGTGSMDVPKNTLPPDRRDYICGLFDWILRPKTSLMSYPFDLIYMGHKSSDVDPFEGPVPLNTDATELGGVSLVFPLRHWTDEDIWNYLEANHIPLQATRYKDREEIEDKSYSNDWINACTLCIDPREKAAEVRCPKLKRMVKNVSANVLKLQVHPHYVQS